MRRALVIVVVLGLCLGLVPAGIPNARPPYTNLVVRKVGPGDAALNLVCATGPGGSLARRYTVTPALAPRAMRVLLSTYYDGSLTDPCEGAGTVERSQPLCGLVEMLWEYSRGTRAAAIYPATGEAATAAYFPFIAVRASNETRLVLRNDGDGPADVATHFLTRPGVKTATVPAGQERVYSLAELPEVAIGGYGTAYATSARPTVALETVDSPTGSGVSAGITTGDTAIWVSRSTPRQVGSSPRLGQ